MRRRGRLRHEPRARTRRFSKRAPWERPRPSAKPRMYEVSADGRRAAGSGERAKQLMRERLRGRARSTRALRLSLVPAPQPGCFTLERWVVCLAGSTVDGGRKWQKARAGAHAQGGAREWEACWGSEWRWCARGIIARSSGGGGSQMYHPPGAHLLILSTHSPSGPPSARARLKPRDRKSVV